MLKTILFIVLSGVVLLGELHMLIQYQPVSDLFLRVLYHNGQTQVFTLYFIIIVFFGYMTFVCSYTIFSIKVFGFYGFYERKTDPVTFLTFVFYFAKLTYPLCYTTLYILLGSKNSNNLKRTAFYTVAYSYPRASVTSRRCQFSATTYRNTCLCSSWCSASSSCLTSLGNCCGGWASRCMSSVWKPSAALRKKGA